MAVEYLNIRTSRDGLAAYVISATDGVLVDLAAGVSTPVTWPVDAQAALIGSPTSFYISDEAITPVAGPSRAQIDTVGWSKGVGSTQLFLLSIEASQVNVSFYKLAGN